MSQETETETENKRAIEALLMVAEEPVKPNQMAQLLELSHQKVEYLCQELAKEYETQNRGFILTKVAGGYRFQSHPNLDTYIERFALESTSARLSAAALETLAIVAYRQPISRAQVAEIRGVNADAVMRTLTVRGFIEELSNTSGRVSMFVTTDEFLERLGINSLEDLPKLSGFIPPVEVAEALEAELRSTARLAATESTQNQ